MVENHFLLNVKERTKWTQGDARVGLVEEEQLRNNILTLSESGSERGLDCYLFIINELFMFKAGTLSTLKTIKTTPITHFHFCNGTRPRCIE